MTDSITTSAPDAPHDTTELRSLLKSGNEKAQLQLLQQITDAGLDVLMEFLLERRSNPPTPVDGKAYQVLANANSLKAQEFLQSHFPTGLVPLHSDKGIDYSPLQELLVKHDFQAADQKTIQTLCELAGGTAVQRKWLYFTDVDNFPIADLQTINTLWLVYSEGKFGFSVQREIWLGAGQNWDKLWSKIGWKRGNNWTRYPHEFTWDLTAPRGHLPLSNQLRGVRVIAALLAHPAWLS